MDVDPMEGLIRLRAQAELQCERQAIQEAEFQSIKEGKDVSPNSIGASTKVGTAWTSLLRSCPINLIEAADSALRDAGRGAL